MIIKDLDLCTYDDWYQKEFPGCLAIGWIHSDEDYKPHGVLVTEFILALKSLIDKKKNIQGPLYMGIHDCEFCRKEINEKKQNIKKLSRQEWELKYNKGKDYITSERKLEDNYRQERHDNLIIEHNGETYACSELLLHYIEKHEYIPPIKFQMAVI